MKRQRQSGFLIVELVMAVAILAVGLLAFLGSFFSNYRAFNTVQELDEASLALESVAEELRGAVFADVYTNYHGQRVQVPNLVGPDDNPAEVHITCFVDEATLPAAFGPLQDLDGDPNNQTNDASGSYRLLPVRLSLTYAASDGFQTREIYLVLGSD